MHLLNTTSAILDGLGEPVDLRQPVGRMAVLSFTDSDLAGLAAAWQLESDALPSLRLVHLRDLRHPMSVDLWIERTGASAKVILLRLLGGLAWWRYGAERLAGLARDRGIALAVLPGEDRDDPELSELSTLPAEEVSLLLRYFRAGGPRNLRGVLRRLSCRAGTFLEAQPPEPLPGASCYVPGEGEVSLQRLRAGLQHGWPIVPIVFYRSMLLAADVAPVDALASALAERGLAAAPIFVGSLKDPVSRSFLRDSFSALDPALVITATAFAGGDSTDVPLLDAPGVPVLQAVMATTPRSAWVESSRGLAAADLAMHVVLPELDGRVLAGAVSFKDPLPPHEGLAFTRQINRSEPDRVAQVADRAAALVRLRGTPVAERRIGMLLPDYPGVGGRTGYAVGLDVPASVLALLDDLRGAGYTVAGVPNSAAELLAALETETPCLPLATYEKFFSRLPEDTRAAIGAAWGAPDQDPQLREGVFHFRVLHTGGVTVMVAPDRGRSSDRRADYHDPILPPRHALLAFGLWLRGEMDVHALVHIGAHGTLEWLPGKAVALSAKCFPELVLGALPVIYPFLVSNPGEAAQAKRRIAAVTLGHLPPELTNPGLSEHLRDLERLVDEFASADGLDHRRRLRLVPLILAAADRAGLADELDLSTTIGPEDALARIDAWLCDLKELSIKDGLHIYGRSTERDGPERRESSESERSALLAALDGRHVPAGPAGAPGRGRRDVLPTGRNMHTADPRGLPTRTALDLGRIAADEVVRAYMQEHGDVPRTLVLDLWASATLRTGGEEIAHGLALLGCRPEWDADSGRVTGIEVLPPAVMGRPRVDVTWRISGLFRDLFPAQLNLLDLAVRAVAARDEEDAENPLAACRRAGASLQRVFGTAPGAYGAGVEDALTSGRWSAREELGRAYLSAASHAYGNADGSCTFATGAFADRVSSADLLVHAGDDPGRDLLEGGADSAFLGGFAAAAALLGGKPMLMALDTTKPARPRARELGKALSRVVRGRAADPCFIAGQMRHGPRGASELAETVDRLVCFAETTDAVPGALLELIYDAYLRNAEVRDFLLRENPAAARSIASRLASARRRGLWHPRRNDVDEDLAILAVRP